MNTRPLDPADAHAIAELWIAGANESAAVHGAFRPRLSTAEYGASTEADLRGGACIGWGLFDDAGRLLGYLTARVSLPSVEFEQAPFLYLLDLDVRAGFRRQGVATRLVEQAWRFAAEQALGAIEVSWLSSDPRASAFWQSQGFAPYLARAQRIVPASPPGRAAAAADTAPPALTVQRMRPDQASPTAALIVQGLTDRWGGYDPAMNPDLERFPARFEDALILVACRADEVLGVGILRPSAEGAAAETVEIVRMSVRRDLRRTGIGTKILAELLAAARQRGSRTVRVETTASWESAVRFYERHGFRRLHIEAGDQHLALAL